MACLCVRYWAVPWSVWILRVLFVVVFSPVPCGVRGFGRRPPFCSVIAAVFVVRSYVIVFVPEGVVDEVTRLKFLYP